MSVARDPQTKWQKHAVTAAELRRNIQAINTVARNGANQDDDQTALEHLIAALEKICTNDIAAQAFYTQSEQRRPQ